MDLALNNHRMLIYHKTQITNQPKKYFVFYLYKFIYY